MSLLYNGARYIDGGAEIRFHSTKTDRWKLVITIGIWLSTAFQAASWKIQYYIKQVNQPILIRMDWFTYSNVIILFSLSAIFTGHI